MAVLRPHHEDVARVRLEVGHGVRLGVDPVECYLVPHCAVLLRLPDGRHHPARLQVAAVVLDGVADQGRGSVIGVLGGMRG